jgi:hypothetical protein
MLMGHDSSAQRSPERGAAQKIRDTPGELGTAGRRLRPERGCASNERGARLTPRPGIDVTHGSAHFVAPPRSVAAVRRVWAFSAFSLHGVFEQEIHGYVFLMTVRASLAVTLVTISVFAS